MKTDRELLLEANALIRSFYMIAKREGLNTHWEALKNCIEPMLFEQNSFLALPENNKPKNKFLNKQ